LHRASTALNMVHHGHRFWSIVDDIDPSTYVQLTAVVE
jgi:hypothetical protein